MTKQAKNEGRHLGLTIDVDDLAWFEDSPDTGDPACICSHCGNIVEEYETVLRLLKASEGTEARLCETCLDLLLR